MVREQFNTDATTTAPPTATAASTTAPLFRSFAPSATGTTRYFPRLSTILAGTTPNGTDGEIIPSVARTMNFDFSVRDGLGGIACDEIALTVANTGAAFLITSQNSATSWTANGTNTATVTWNVAGTTGNGINAANVDILVALEAKLKFARRESADPPLAANQPPRSQHLAALSDLPGQAG